VPKTYGTTGPRSLYPEMCDSRSLSRCGLLANALWPRLIVQADDQGRLHGDAADIRGLCFPKMPRVTARAVSDALDELAEVGSIARYAVRDEPYIQVADWWQYQSFQRRAYPSRFPAPDDWQDLAYGIPGFPETFAAARRVSPRAAAKRDHSPPSPSRPVQAHPKIARPSAPLAAANGTDSQDDEETTLARHAAAAGGFVATLPGKAS